MKRVARFSLALVASLAMTAAVGCVEPDEGSTGYDSDGDGDVDVVEKDGLAVRPTVTIEQCQARGTVIGDIGDGAVHRADYRCPNNKIPFAYVQIRSVEGSVCCER